MESMVKDFMRKNKVMITYVRDVYGFRYGVIVAIGKDKVGWSQVNMSEDIKYKVMLPKQIPSINRMMDMMIQNKEPLEEVCYEVMNHPAYRKLLDATCVVKVPNFNKDMGIMTAINRALNSETKVVDTVEEDGRSIVALEGKVPSDKKMLVKLFDIIERSRRGKW